MLTVTERIPFFADPNNARQAALKRVELDRQKDQELDNLRLILQTKPIDSTPQSTQPAKPTLDVTRTREQIEAIDLQLSTCTDPKAWDALTRAKERLFRIWAHLSGIPGPGNLKPASPRTRATPQPVVYSLPVATPTDASGSGSNVGK